MKTDTIKPTVCIKQRTLFLLSFWKQPKKRAGSEYGSVTDPEHYLKKTYSTIGYKQCAKTGGASVNHKHMLYLCGI